MNVGGFVYCGYSRSPAANDSDRQLEIDEGSDPLVEALVTGADEDEVAAGREIAGALLPERLAGRVEQDDG